MKILIADDDRNLRRVLANELSEEGFKIGEAENGRRAIDLLQKDEYDILLLDLNMPDFSGMEVLKKVKSLELPVEVIILTAHATVTTAVEAMKLSAYDYLTKPFGVKELIAVMEKAYEKKELLHENLILKSQIKRQSKNTKIVTQSPLFSKLLENVKTVALSDIPVLISGESGVGKELIARTIHEAGNRAERPFIAINCGAISENMMESELFGHEKGSFTSAHEKKLGLLEIANQGTLLLDEVGEMSMPLQTKLLRAIETRKFFRVGGTKEVEVDVRFLSATNKNIKEELEKGRFREDLFYRISTITLPVPPLRARKEDIPLLIDHFLNNQTGGKNKKFTQSALRVLSEYSWPGNVRELQNVVYRALLLTKKETIEAEDLLLNLAGERNVSNQRLEEVEKKHILNVLRETGDQKGKAAEILGLDPKTLYRKLSSYNINVDDAGLAKRKAK